ncbi:MAG: CgeB family protein [Devosia sp.]
MNFLFYTHSQVSDWNHGNAHFLRGVLRALHKCGHETRVLEPLGAWSRENLVAEQGQGALRGFARDFPDLTSETYDGAFDHEAALAAADVVVVHEWTDPALVARIGRHRRSSGRYLLLFHDTHHRAISAEDDIAGLELEDYDAILAFGETLSERYRKAGWGRRVFTWHEASDLTVFRPIPEIAPTEDLVWVGNWGDGERTRELHEFLIAPVSQLRLSTGVHGVRYPDEALEALADAGITYRGWIANADVPMAFAAHTLSVHVPRRPYVEALPGIPTIRMFEALACGIPLVSAPWQDVEALFRPGEDFLFAHDGDEMTRLLATLLADPAMRAEMVASGLKTIRTRHSCDHRVEELLTIIARCGKTHPAMETA